VSGSLGGGGGGAANLHKPDRRWNGDGYEWGDVSEWMDQGEREGTDLFDAFSPGPFYRSSKAAPTAWTPSLFFSAMDAKGSGEEHAVDPWWWGEAAFGFGLATVPVETSSAQENKHRRSEAGAALGSSSMVVAG
jgi:hypothetical protein